MLVVGSSGQAAARARLAYLSDQPRAAQKGVVGVWGNVGDQKRRGGSAWFWSQWSMKGKS